MTSEALSLERVYGSPPVWAQHPAVSHGLYWYRPFGATGGAREWRVAVDVVQLRAAVQHDALSKVDVLPNVPYYRES
jgi:hypothetical protein